MSRVKACGVAFFATIPWSALAYTYQTFYGWSLDGSYYAQAYSGTDMVHHPQLCLSDMRVGSATWPSAIDRPSDSECTNLCSEGVDCTKKAKRLVRLPAFSKTGPHGEQVQEKIEKGRATVVVLGAGKKLAETTVEFDKENENPTIQKVYWRADGGAVAVYLGSPEPEPGEETEGYPPPRYLPVLTWKQAANLQSSLSSGNRSAAEAANTRGMKRYRAKDYSGAKSEFQSALAADSTYVLAHYNLACVSALLGDRKRAIAELKWLAASNDTLAKAKRTKARTDPDLKSIVNDPDVRKILGASPGSCDCDAAREKCEGDCVDEIAAENVRGCVRLCGSQFEDCSAKCEGK